MPFNLLKKYPELLEILHLGNKERKASLYRVYRRDIEDNEAFKFREKRVYPIKSDGEIDMQREFMHLTTTDDKEAEGAATKKESSSQTVPAVCIGFATISRKGLPMYWRYSVVRKGI